MIFEEIINRVTKIVMKIFEEETKERQSNNREREERREKREERDRPISRDDHIETFFQLEIIEQSTRDQHARLDQTQPTGFLLLTIENRIRISFETINSSLLFIKQSLWVVREGFEEMQTSNASFISIGQKKKRFQSNRLSQLSVAKTKSCEREHSESTSTFPSKDSHLPVIQPDRSFRHPTEKYFDS